MTRAVRSMWPWAIAGSLVAVVTLNLTMVAVAVRHPSMPASTVPDPGAEDYGPVQRARAASRALGWQASIAFAAEPRGAVELSIHDGEGRPVEGLSGELALRRADDAGLDRTATLVEVAPGRYRAEPTLARGGYYDLSARLEGGEAPWLLDRRVFIEDGSPR